jgi:hypothetical protein
MYCQLRSTIKNVRLISRSAAVIGINICPCNIWAVYIRQTAAVQRCAKVSPDLLHGIALHQLPVTSRRAASKMPGCNIQGTH